MSLDFVALGQYANISFDDFKTSYQQGNSIAAQYYGVLEAQATSSNLANVANYAALAQDVATNDTFRGRFANQFSLNVAAQSGVGFSVGSDKWLEMQWTLMQRDFNARQVDDNQDGELNYEQTNRIHETAFAAN